ncbi:MAG: UDP-N-acetylmuramoyl-L-alanine--D-glutamate ligase [Acidimicrobiales bacterium]
MNGASGSAVDGANLDVERPLVLGFGVVGQALVRALKQRGHQPIVADDRPTDAGRLLADELGVELIAAPSRERLSRLVADASVLLPSPGVPDHHPAFQAAREFGVGVRSELDLAARWDDRPLASITGTNGKTSVTMMVTDALERSGVRAAAVGNTDVPLITAIDDATIEVFVVEASSFRLGHSHRFSPAVGTWINYAPDHLDAHASAASYEAAKASIWSHLRPEALVVANADDPVVMRNVPESHDRIELFSLIDSGASWRVDGDELVGPDGAFAEISDLQRKQPHDVANALAVAATAVGAGATIEGVADAVRLFAGLPHRLELVGEWDGIVWYNDSKATVPQATEAAVMGFDSVVLIAGGKNKGLALDGLRSTVPPVRHVVAIGDSEKDVTDVFAGLVPVTGAGDMAAAVAAAGEVAQPGDAVVLSPGCASFDWYPNYAERGLDFSRLVRERATRS